MDLIGPRRGLREFSSPLPIWERTRLGEFLGKWAVVWCPPGEKENIPGNFVCWWPIKESFLRGLCVLLKNPWGPGFFSKKGPPCAMFFGPKTGGHTFWGEKHPLLGAKNCWGQKVGFWSQREKNLLRRRT